MFYLLYTTEIESIVLNNAMQVHVYADDCKIYFSYNPENKLEAEKKLDSCVNSLKAWMSANYLKLNSDKTVVKVFRPERQNSDPTIDKFSLFDNNVSTEPLKSVKLLGVILGQNMNFKEFVNRKVQICNLQLRNLWSIRMCLPLETRILLVTNLIISNLDYCNSLLISSPNYVVATLQRALNKAVRFIFSVRRGEHITPYLLKLHLLPVSYRIKYKIILIAFKILHKVSPIYLTEKIQTFYPTTTTYLRPGSGRDQFMFEISLNQIKNGNLLTLMISEWNSLPLNLRKIRELNVFKTHLKTCMFKQAFASLL